MSARPPAPPPVTVLIPVRDVADTIAAAVGSIQAQTAGDLELLVVDDGSTDDTVAIVRRIARDDDRVRLIELGAPRGIVPALNRGLDEARAPLIARMDGDDLALPERLAVQRARMDADPELGVCDSRVEIFRDDGPIGGGYRAYQEWLDGIEQHADFDREFLVENPIVHPAAMARAALLRHVGGYRDGDWPEDYDLWLRCHRAGARFHKLPERLVRWRDHGRRLTRTDDRYRRTAFFPLKWRHLRRTRLRAGLRVAVWGAGPTARPWLRALAREAEVTLAAVYDIDPRKIGRARQGVEVRPIEAVADGGFDLLLAAVGARGARALIREWLGECGIVEGRDALFVA